MKRQVILQFLTLTSLKAFQEKISLIFFEIGAKGKLLRCACTDEQIKLATTKYCAVLVDKLEVGRKAFVNK